MPDVDCLGSGVRTRVATKGGLAAADDTSELAGSAVAGDDSLVTDSDELNEIPPGPGLDGVDLLRNGGVRGVAARRVNEDTQDELETDLSTSTTNIGEGVAIGGVDTDGGEAGVLDVLDIGHDGISALAEATAGVGGVGDGILVTAATQRGAADGRLGRS